MNRLGGRVLVLTLVAGGVFALQGLRVLPSQVMYGRPEWVIVGSLMVVGSLAGLVRLRGR